MVAVFVATVLVGWAVLCIAKYRKWHRRKKCNQLVHAKVIEVLERKPMRGSDTLYKPIFLVEGWNVRIDSAYYSNLLHLMPNTYIDLLIDPNDYNNFIYVDRALNKGLIADIGCCCLPIIFLIAILIMSIAHN